MTAVSVTAPAASDGIAARLGWTLQDTITVTKRNLLGLLRVPEAVFFSSVQPVMFVLLFRYAFGGAIPTGNVPYVDYMMPGIFVQSVAFGSIGTAIGLSEDLHKGIIERFRALPMARSAVLAGRTTADLVRNVFVALLMTGVGFAVGFRIHTSVVSYAVAIALLLLFAYALSWGFAVIGLMAPTSEAAQLMSFPLLFPLVFASSAFVPLTTMPHWLQHFARHQPVTIVINAARNLMTGGPYVHGLGGSTGSSCLQAVAWSVGILVVLAPLAVHRYRRIA